MYIYIMNKIIKLPFKILGTGSYFPKKIINNDGLRFKSNNPNLIPNNKWVINKLGIYKRHIVENELTSDLGYKSSLKALNDANLKINDIDLIITNTSSPDRISPSTACIIQDKLNPQKYIPSFDLGAVCSGFLFSIDISSQLLDKYENILIISSETYSKFTDYNNRNCVFFGDGAASIIITKGKNGWYSGNIYSDGKGKENFTVHHGKKFQMNGKEVYNTGIKVLPTAINKTLNDLKMNIDEIDYFIPHQPSIKILEKTADIINLPREKIIMNMDLRGNTAGASIPTVLDKLKNEIKFKNNDKILFAAVGSGWTWGAGVLNFEI